MGLCWLTRRTRTLARQPQTLTAGLYIVGCFYNLCDPHHSLRLRLSVGRFGHHWVNRTPAMAAELTDHIWTVDELLMYRIPSPRWEPPKQRGRRSKELLQQRFPQVQEWYNPNKVFVKYRRLGSNKMRCLCHEDTQISIC